jgi:hypothetical protein
VPLSPPFASPPPPLLKSLLSIYVLKWGTDRRPHCNLPARAN